MNIFSYIKRKIFLFMAIVLLSGMLFSVQDKKDTRAADSHENAYVACFIDDDTNTYKFQVIYSGVEIEYSHVTSLFPAGVLNLSSEGNTRLGLYDGYWVRNNEVQYGKKIYTTTVDINDDTGMVDLNFAAMGGDNVDATNVNFSCNSIPVDATRPLTFPANNRNASSADINRAYEVIDAISEDFNDALLFINDGKAFDSSETMIQTAYYLVTCPNSGGIITNQFGTQYRITYSPTPEPGSNGYLYTVTISKVKGSGDPNPDRSATYYYKVKKGYRNAENDEIMENGSKNKLNKSGVENDTEYITWEHFFLEAGVLYSEGITYSNQADLYSFTDLENSLLDVTRNLFGGIRSMLQLYSMEDLMFNTGIRGSLAFTYGIYDENWNNNVTMLFLILTVIALCAYLISIIVLIIKKLFSTVSPTARLSLLEGIRDILLSIFFIAFAWVFFKLVMLVNFKFVEMFAVLKGDRTLADVSSVYSSLASILFQFMYLVITIYVNMVYFIRAIFVPALFAGSPLFIYAYSHGYKWKRLTSAWLKELLGFIFIQSIHAFVYGFVLISSNGLRGIEMLVLCASIIPLTQKMKDLFDLGGDSMLRMASNATVMSAGMGAAALSAGSGAVNIAASGVAGVASNFGELGQKIGSVATTVGNVSTISSNISQVGLGMGMSAGLGIGDDRSFISGHNMMNRYMDNTIHNTVNTGTRLSSSAGNLIGEGIATFRKGVSSNSLSGSGSVGSSGVQSTNGSYSSMESSDATPQANSVDVRQNINTTSLSPNIVNEIRENHQGYNEPVGQTVHTPQSTSSFPVFDGLNNNYDYEGEAFNNLMLDDVTTSSYDFDNISTTSQEDEY